MKRFTLALLALFAVASISTAVVTAVPVPAAAQEDSAEFPEGKEPAVVLSEESAVDDDAAWTFRFLVPTVLVMATVALPLVVVLYVARVRGRYRVAR